MRRLLVIMLASLTALGGAASAMRMIRAAGEHADFSLSVNPVHQTTVRGRDVTFSVHTKRSEGFSGATTLRMTKLPRGVSVRWQLADGTHTGVVPPSETGAILTLRASARTPLRTWRMKLRATGGATTRTQTLILRIKRRGTLHYALRIRPRARIVAQGASATYRTRLERNARFRRRPLSVRVLGLPRNTTATSKGGLLTVQTRPDQKPGSYRLVVVASHHAGRRVYHRYGTAVLRIVRARRFSIAGDLAVALYPGRRVPLDLILTNPQPFDLRVVALDVRLRPASTNPRCSGADNYAVTPYRGRYPLVLHPGSTRLSSLVVTSPVWPQISMRNLATNQDACKGARLSLEYNGLAIR